MHHCTIFNENNLVRSAFRVCFTSGICWTSKNRGSKVNFDKTQWLYLNYSKSGCIAFTSCRFQYERENMKAKNEKATIESSCCAHLANAAAAAQTTTDLERSYLFRALIKIWFSDKYVGEFTISLFYGLPPRKQVSLQGRCNWLDSTLTFKHHCVHCQY